MASQILFLVLRLSCFSLLLGRSLQHLIWDAPYRSIFWDEGLMKPFVESFLGMSWESYASSPEVDSLINMFTRILGCVYALGAVVCLLPARWLMRFRWVLIFNSLLLIILAVLYSKERGFQLAMFIEYASQFLTPLILVAILKKEVDQGLILSWLKIAVSGTFIGHGFYALGWPYALPGPFIDMTILLLNVKQSTAVQLLLVIGILDVALAILIWNKKFVILACTYACLWGFATALARPLVYIDSQLLGLSLLQWGPEFLVRIPHAAVPFAILLLLWRIRSGEPCQQTQT